MHELIGIEWVKIEARWVSSHRISQGYPWKPSLTVQAPGLRIPWPNLIIKSDLNAVMEKLNLHTILDTTQSCDQDWEASNNGFLYAT